MSARTLPEGTSLLKTSHGACDARKATAYRRMRNTSFISVFYYISFHLEVGTIYLVPSAVNQHPQGWKSLYIKQRKYVTIPGHVIVYNGRPTKRSKPSLAQCNDRGQHRISGTAQTPNGFQGIAGRDRRHNHRPKNRIYRSRLSTCT